MSGGEAGEGPGAGEKPGTRENPGAGEGPGSADAPGTGDAPGAPRAARRTGRRPGGDDTRGRILDAAREAFGERGYEGSSVREIAARAGVDGALVHHYFGTKQRLFMTAMRLPPEVATDAERVLTGPPDEVGRRLVAHVITLWDRPDVRHLMLGIVRSAATDPAAAELARRMLAEGPFLAIARALGTPDAEARASLIGTHILGLLMARFVLGLEPVASMTADELAEAIGPAVTHYLVGDLRRADGPASG